MFLAIIITSCFVPQKNLPADNSACPQGMLEYIRNNDETVLKGCDKVGIERKWMIILLFSKPDELMYRERLVGKFIYLFIYLLFIYYYFLFCAWHTVSLVRRCYYSIINVFLLPRTGGTVSKFRPPRLCFCYVTKHDSSALLHQCMNDSHVWITIHPTNQANVSDWNKVLCFVFFGRFCLFTKQICCLQNQLLSCLMWQVSAM